MRRWWRGRGRERGSGRGGERCRGLAGSGAGAGGQFASLPGDGPPERLGYGAGYNAGFLAGLLAASQGGVLPQGPVPGAAAAERGVGPSASEPARPPFLALLEDFPDLFQKEVLERLDRVDLALLGRTGSTVRTAVKSSALVRVGRSAGGTRVGVAAFCRSLSMFVWAVANGCPWQIKATSRTLAGGGHLEVLRWAREHGCPWHERACESATEGGHLEVLRWAREHGCSWDALTCSRAAWGGHLEVLRWAREHGCPWDEATCFWAAAGGHLELLKWARKHHCPWDSRTCGYAAAGGHLNLLQWAREHHCPWIDTTCAWPLREVTWRCCAGRGSTTARGMKRHALTLLLVGTWRCCNGRGSTTARGMRIPVRIAAGRGHLELLKWAREHECPWNEETCARAAHCGEMEVLSWAIEHGCPGGERYAHHLT